MSHQYLWKKLLRAPGYKKDGKYAPSNQKPRKILDSYGLLEKIKSRRRSAIGYDKYSRRVFWISKKQLEDAILDSEFEDLEYRLIENPLNPQISYDY